jgi:hypothetical protein
MLGDKSSLCVYLSSFMHVIDPWTNFNRDVNNAHEQNYVFPRYGGTQCLNVAVSMTRSSWKVSLTSFISTTADTNKWMITHVATTDNIMTLCVKLFFLFEASFTCRFHISFILWFIYRLLVSRTLAIGIWITFSKQCLQTNTEVWYSSKFLLLQVPHI